MPNPLGINQYSKGGGKGGRSKAEKEFKKKFGRFPKAGEKSFVKGGRSAGELAFKKKFGRFPKAGEKSFGK